MSTLTEKLIIRNATLVNEGREFESDVLIKNGRIEKIATSIGADGTEIEAAGRFLLPGMIDDQVHFREPGLTHKGNIASESRAAVAGGITSFMEMPNTSPPTADAEALEAKYARAAQGAHANYAFYMGATNDNIEAIRAIDPEATCGLKVFMGASTGNMLVDDEKILEQIFADSPVMVVTHCEDTPTVERDLARIRAERGDDLPPSVHPQVRTAEACWRSSKLAVGLARKHGTQLHVLHLTTAREMAHFEPGPIADKQITAEACVHHLLLSHDDYESRGNLIKCNPAIKYESDRQALLQALADDRLDIIATDHAPHLLEEKDTGYLRAAAGLPLVQHALPLALEHVHEGTLPLVKVVEKTAHNPAVRFAVKERGFLREGYWADLTLIDMHAATTVAREDVLYHCGWSPFEGTTLRSRVQTTIVSGRIAWHDGRVIEHDGARRLEFNR